MAIKPSDINRRNKEFWGGRASITYDLSRSYSDIERFYGTSGRFGTSGSMGVSGSAGTSGVSRSPDMLREYLDISKAKEIKAKENKLIDEKDKKPQKEVKHKRSIEF